MRIYYIFNIKKEIYNVYKDTPSVLYNFFRRLYYYDKNNLDYCNTIYRQITNKYNKELLDLKIYLKLHNKLRYIKRYEEHIINDLFKNEISIMKVKKSYIVINCNNNYTEFFSIINNFYNYCFVCDFINQDYFYLSKIKILV